MISRKKYSQTEKKKNKLMGFFSLQFLSRLVYKDILAILQSRRERRMGEMYVDQQRRERRYT